MHFSASNLLAAAAMVSTAVSHGIYSTPKPRTPGAASLAACGPNVIKNIQGDNTSHVEGLPETAATDPKYSAAKCNLWLCRGLQFDDNKDNVLKLTPGQVLNQTVWLRIPHFGTANVSIVDTKANTIIGSQLLYWDKYADEKLKTLPANNTQFSITIPTTLGSKCATAGDCVIQWWWYGTGAKQTYESCLDFTVAPAMPMVKVRHFAALN